MSYDYQLSKADGYAERHGYVHVGYKVVMQFGNVLMAWWPLTRCCSNLLIKDVPCTSARTLDSALRSQLDIVFTAFGLLEQMARRLNGPAGLDAGPMIGFHPRQLMQDEGRPGFHVAATADQAMGLTGGYGQANPFGTHEVQVMDQPVPAYWPGDQIPRTVDARVERRVREPGALVRVLVPEHAVHFVPDPPPVNPEHNWQFSKDLFRTGLHRCRAMVVIPPGEKETEQDIALCDAYNAQHAPKPQPLPKPRAKPLTEADCKALDKVLAETNAPA